MGVWIDLAVESALPAGGSRASVRCVALVKTGYEAHRRQLIMPIDIAADLGLWPAPRKARLREFGSASGLFTVYEIRSGCRVRVSAGTGRRAVVADAIVNPPETEVLISDALASALHLAVLDPRRGIWAFRDELDHPRKSARKKR